MGSKDWKDSWRTPAFRGSVVSKLDECIEKYGISHMVDRSGTEMEDHVYKKSKSREGYMNGIAKQVLHLREICDSCKTMSTRQAPSQAPQRPYNNQESTSALTNDLQNLNINDEK